ncbi:hypothetical protein FRC02_012161 [Tulasnella sp. 418]|nr:hypothetical protein FRC02_012161 [Tulasnella sp. 418]
MSSFWTSPTSPIAAENDPRKKIQDFKARLSTAKQKLNDLRIPMMKETLARIEDFLEVCEKSKGDNGPITEFINLLTRFIDDVLDPVSKENQRGEVRITGVLAEKIRILLTELYQVIPQKDHISALSWNRMDHGVDVSGDLAIANPRINDALQTFMVIYASP